MIFLDNGAGSWPKPFRVGQAMQQALGKYGANPGRGAYALSRATSDMAEGVRAQLAALLHAPEAERVIFTAGATHSLNLAIFGLLRPGDHAVCSSMEHNAVFRPLAALADRGVIELSVAQADRWGYLSVDSLRACLRPNTRLVAFTHVSNVCGSVQPAGQLCAAARAAGALSLVDASQSAGLFDLDVQELNADAVALAGHKALYGPPGVGALWLGADAEPVPLLYGGAGCSSELRDMPPCLPLRYEAGTLNTVGIAGWGAALTQLADLGVNALLEHTMQLTQRLETLLRDIPGLVVLRQEQESRPCAPVLAAYAPGRPSEQVAELLDQQGVAVRAGLHCAPQAHLTLGTMPDGALRFTPGWFNTMTEIEKAARILRDVLADS